MFPQEPASVPTCRFMQARAPRRCETFSTGGNGPVTAAIMPMRAAFILPIQARTTSGSSMQQRRVIPPSTSAAALGRSGHARWLRKLRDNKKRPQCVGHQHSTKPGDETRLRWAQAYGIAVNPSWTKVYVANSGSSSVSVIDTATNMAGTPFCRHKRRIGLPSRDGNIRLCRKSRQRHGFGISTAPDMVVQTVTVGTNPEGVAALLMAAKSLSSIPICPRVLTVGD